MNNTFNFRCYCPHLLNLRWKCADSHAVFYGSMIRICFFITSYQMAVDACLFQPVHQGGNGITRPVCPGVSYFINFARSRTCVSEGQGLEISDRIPCLPVVINKPPYLLCQPNKVKEYLLLYPGKKGKPVYYQHIYIAD